MPDESRKLLSIKRVAHMLDVSARTVWRLLAEKDFPKPTKIGKANRWFADEVEAYIAMTKYTKPRVEK